MKLKVNILSDRGETFAKSSGCDLVLENWNKLCGGSRADSVSLTSLVKCLHNNFIFYDLRSLFWPYSDILITDQQDNLCLCMEIGDLFFIIGATPNLKWKLKYHKIQKLSCYSGHYWDRVSSFRHQHQHQWSTSRGINDISILQSRELLGPTTQYSSFWTVCCIPVYFLILAMSVLEG